MALANVHINEWHEKAVAEAKAAQAILTEFKGKELPKDKEEQVDKHLAQHDVYKARADREFQAAEAVKAIDADPVVKHSFTDGGRADVRLDDEQHRKALGKFLFKGVGALSESEAKLLVPSGTKTLSSLSDPDGGATLRGQVLNELITKLKNRVKMRQFARVITTDAPFVEALTYDFEDTPPTVIENAAVAEVDVANIFGKKTFVPKDKARILRVPKTLIEDSDFDIVDMLLDDYAGIYARLEERVFFTGDGATEGKGILTESLPAADIAGSTTVVAVEDIINAEYDLPEQYRGLTAGYLMHRNYVRRFRKLRSDGGGGAGTGEFLWQPSVQAGEPARLNGRPVIESEWMPDPDAVGSADGDAAFIFGDLKRFWIVDRRSLTIQRLVERYAEYRQVGFVLDKRFDSGVTLLEAFKRYNRK